MAYFISNHPSGGTYFCTMRLKDKTSTLLVDEVDHLRDAMRKTIQRYPFHIDAIVILPSMIHTVWTLPQGDTELSKRWGMLKSQFSKVLIEAGQNGVASNKIWQRRFWDHPIRDRNDFETHQKLIHTSPVQAGLCATPQDWQYSSVHRCNMAMGAAKKRQRSLAVKAPSPAIIHAATYREEGFSHFS